MNKLAKRSIPLAAVQTNRYSASCSTSNAKKTAICFAKCEGSCPWRGWFTLGLVHRASPTGL
jgi:hypothetical protein